MPTYCYRRLDNDEVVEVQMTMEEQSRRHREDGTIVLDDGTVAVHDIRAQWLGRRDTTGNWPMSSVAMGCTPEEVPRVRREYEKLGIKNPQFVIKHEGAELVLPTRGYRKKALKALGLADAQGGYGD